MTEGFIEDVLVHLEDSKPVAAQKAEPAAAVDTSRVDAAKAEAAKADAARVEAARAEAARADAARIEAARAESAKAEAARAEAAKIEAAKAEADRAAAAKVEAAKAEAAKAEAAKAATAKAAADKIAETKKRMEKNLNDGKPANGNLAVAQLQKDDLLFVDGDIRGVVRREGAHTQLFWLEGDLNVDRVELIPNGTDRYKVAEPIRNVANPTLRTHETNQHLIGNVPAPNSAERKSLQQQFSDGKDVSGSVHPTDLRQGDIVYIGKGVALVNRRDGNDLLHYWLDGDLNLGQTGLIKQGANAYRVLTDTIK
jgi:hypothetical protein